jgi:hypothetical protein
MDQGQCEALGRTLLCLDPKARWEKLLNIAISIQVIPAQDTAETSYDRKAVSDLFGEQRSFVDYTELTRRLSGVRKPTPFVGTLPPCPWKNGAQAPPHFGLKYTNAPIVYTKTLNHVQIEHLIDIAKLWMCKSNLAVTKRGERIALPLPKEMTGQWLRQLGYGAGKWAEAHNLRCRISCLLGDPMWISYVGREGYPVVCRKGLTDYGARVVTVVDNGGCGELVSHVLACLHVMWLQTAYHCRYYIVHDVYRKMCEDVGVEFDRKHAQKLAKSPDFDCAVFVPIAEENADTAPPPVTLQMVMATHPTLLQEFRQVGYWLAKRMPEHAAKRHAIGTLGNIIVAGMSISNHPRKVPAYSFGGLVWCNRWRTLTPAASSLDLKGRLITRRTRPPARWMLGTTFLHQHKSTTLAWRRERPARAHD